MEKERSLVFVKPGHLEKWSTILSCLDFGLTEFYRIKFERTIPVRIFPERDEIEKHYENIRTQPYFKQTIEVYLEQGLILVLYSGAKVIYPIKELVGDTDPQKAKQGTLRKLFSDDSLELAKKENRFLRNVLHASANPEEARRELEIWRKYFEPPKA